MSFLPGRLAATEGAYFLEESKRAAGRLAKNLPPQSSSNSSKIPNLNLEHNPDVLPEILRHSIPIKAVAPEADASISTATKWNLDKGGNSAKKISRDALNPLSAYVSMPQATFGPKRWQLPSEQPVITASTANDLRQDKYSHVDSRKLKALASGYTQIGKAFFIATMIVFGGAASVFVYTARKLQLESVDDIKTKGKVMVQPRVDRLHEKMAPLRTWVEKTSKKWHIEGDEGKANSFVKEFSKTFGSRT